MGKYTKKKSWTEILFYVYIFGGFLFILLGPDPKKVGGRGSGSRQKACYSNIRVIQGAVEMYNMDQKYMMSDLNVNDLKSGHYLKEDPVPPDRPCSYLGINLDNDGEVYCPFHGDLQGFTPGTYDGSPYMTPDEKLQYKIKSCISRIPYSIIWPLFSHKEGLTTYCK